MSSTRSNYSVVIVAPTCFYYQVALFQELAADPRLDLKVYFCSTEAFGGKDVRKAFKTDDLWGTEGEWLSGYDYKFLRNYSPRPSYFNWPFGLINFGIWNEIKRERPNVVILMAWTNPTWYLAILACQLYGVPFLYLTDANILAERLQPKWKGLIKRLLLGKVIFRLCKGFLCAGTSNKLLYSYFRVPDEKLAIFAYSWGYAALQPVSEELKPKRSQIRAELGIPENSYVILYCGRLSPEKNPIHVLEAYRRLRSSNKALVFVGDGMLRTEMMDYVAKHDLESVYFFGFQKRFEVPKFYSIGDVLVVPSIREATGMVVYEGMNFGLPVIASDQVGAAMDLVVPDYNGFTFPAGDVEALARCLQTLIDMPEAQRTAMASRSRNLITNWSDRDLSDQLVRFLDKLYSADVTGR